MRESYQRVFSNMSWLIAGKILNMILQFIVALATARYLGPSNFGLINYVAAYISFFSSVASLGLSVIVIKEISLGNSDSNEIIWTAIWMRFITAICSATCIIVLMWITNGKDIRLVQIALLESVSIVFSAFDTINYYFQAKLLSKWSSIAGILAYVGMSFYRIVLLIRGADIIWFAFATSTDMILLTIFLLIFYIKCEGFRPVFNRNLGKNLLKQSYHYLISGLITILCAQIDRIMLGHMLDNSSVGLYSAALSISSLWSLIPSAFIQSVIPLLYDLAAKNYQVYLRRLRQTYAMIFLLNTVYSVFCTIFARNIILLLYGEEYLGAIEALVIVVWYYGISTIGTLNGVYLANEHKNRYIKKFFFAGFIVNIVLNMMMIPKAGIVGAAFATLITQIVIQVIMPLTYEDTRGLGITILKGAALRDILSIEEKKTIKTEIKKYFEKKSDRKNEI